MKLLKIVLMLLLSANIVFANIKYDDVPAIVSIDWLKKNYENPNLVIVDLRSEAEYNMSHIKGAVNIPGLKSLFDKDFFMPKLDYLKKTFSEAGIDNKSQVVAYDNGEFIWAARFYWILETLGHTNVGMFKHGYSPWIETKLPMSDEAFKPEMKNFVPIVNNQKIETKLSTLMSLGKKVIIDGRKESHYVGKESLAKRYGHIPTAHNYACTANYQVTKKGNEMKDLNELKEIYKDIPKDKEIILYCDGGAEAALNYVVLQELGYKASIYDGSWVEWGNDKEVPIENPSNSK